MTEIVAIILAVGSLLPLLTSVVQQPTWSQRTRTIVGVAISILAGLVTYVTQYGLDVSSPSAIITVVVGVVLAAAASYRTIWKPSDVAPAIENKVLNVTGSNVKPVDAPVTPANGPSPTLFDDPGH